MMSVLFTDYLFKDGLHDHFFSVQNPPIDTSGSSSSAS